MITAMSVVVNDEGADIRCPQHQVSVVTGLEAAFSHLRQKNRAGHPFP